MRAPFFVAFVAAGIAAAEPPDGQVQIPLAAYASLLGERAGATPPRYTLGPARVTLLVVEEAGAPAVARVHAELTVELLADGLVAVPILPHGTAVTSVLVGGSPASLAALPEGLALVVEGPGTRKVAAAYEVVATGSEGGRTITLPLPAASSVELTATLPGEGIDAAVVPSSGVRRESSGGRTTLIATLPAPAAGTGAMLSWRSPEGPGHALVRAAYEGTLADDTVTFAVVLAVELFSEGTFLPHLLPERVTLLDLHVDGKEAPVVVAEGSYSTPISGRGRHVAKARFQLPVSREGGAPHVDVPLARSPVSRFQLSLPGEKELTVTPAASVERTTTDTTTVATVFVPMGDQVTFAWNEAVPTEGEEGEALRANAAITHAASAEEGVLSVRASVAFEITRGETSAISFSIAPDVQVTRLAAEPVPVADWRMSVDPGGAATLTAFFDQPVSGELHLDVLYDRTIADGATVPLPLLAARDATRQRGMVALLQGRELALQPVDEGGASRVGENQLPAAFKDQLAMSVGHTFKYAELPPAMTVAARPPDRVAGRYDVTIDSLLSLGEATLGGLASVEVNVKSGALDALTLALPSGVNLLTLTGPSVREHALVADGGAQRLDVAFTQPMQGQLRLEVAYEVILDEKVSSLPAPVVSMPAAEVAQGRIAVEARAAVEVTAASAEELTSIEPSDLPRQLVLRTSNPILLAYEYVHAASAPKLVLDVRRHAAVEVQEALIEEAHYRTLVTRDGLAVTTADLLVRNARKQFLRVKLPPDADVWSATVDGAAEKPAREGEGDAASILVKIKSDASGFPVRLVYAIQGSPLRALGTFRARLPRPEILATRSSWEIDLPEELTYGEPRTSMDPARGTLPARAPSPAEPPAPGAAAPPEGAELRIDVPATAVRLQFEKLYANRGPEDSWVAVPYASAVGAAAGKAATVLGTIAAWTGLLLGLRTEGRRARAAWFALAAAGLAGVLATIALLHVAADPAFRLSLGVAGALAARAGIAAWRARRPVAAPAGT